MQCPGVPQSDVANGQCAALPRDCTQATQNLAAVFAAIGQSATTTVAPPVKKLPYLDYYAVYFEIKCMPIICQFVMACQSNNMTVCIYVVYNVSL